MVKKRIFFIYVLCFLISVISSYASEESLTITTYYPSPYGSYRELRSQRIAIGENYIDGSQYCWEGESGCSFPKTIIPSATDLVVQGNVGIGTTAPGAKLQIVTSDSTEYDSATQSSQLTPSDLLDIYNTNTSATNNFAAIRFQARNSLVSIGRIALMQPTSGNTYSAFAFQLRGGTSVTPEVMRIQSNGKVGIGTTSPQEELEVQGNLMVSYYTEPDKYNLIIQPHCVGDCNAKIGYSFITKSYSGGENYPLSFDNAGKVGIGTTGPDFPVSVVKTGAAIAGTLVGSLEAIQDITNKRGVILGYDTSGQIGTIIADSASAASQLAFWTWNSGWGERVRINSAGNVGIGTTSFSRKLFVNGDAGGTTGWYNDSDIALKKDISDMNQYGLSTIMNLRPVNYTIKATSEKQIGLIAQEVKPIIPEIVSGKEGEMGIDYAKLTPILTKAIQELKAEKDKQIEELKAENEALKKRIEILESKQK